ncbi:hypothetical protein [Paenarthrobacter nitroguajacolicus]|uniref:hypothetical protein n=1 Tax=Paenarthrobacter nitroguajacolicus TaxID=211146 RepID=UPI002857CA40|nr:hypothetical protein [Paenarthrobacter nitroguajacolicus]MDR6637087.1 hypothetical protein [Paenarthrobacter nitroguajacolicus]
MTLLELQAAADQVTTVQATDPWKAQMLVLLHFIKELQTPAQLQSVLHTADAHWNLGKGTPLTLETAKSEFWASLNESETDTRLDSHDTRFDRALPYVLEPLGADEDYRSDIGDWFAGVVWDIR